MKRPVCFNWAMTSDSAKPLSDDILDKLLHLPSVPVHPLVGAGFKRVKYPLIDRRGPRGVFLYRVWACIPDAHKNRDMMAISPEAFNIIQSLIISTLI